MAGSRKKVVGLNSSSDGLARQSYSSRWLSVLLSWPVVCFSVSVLWLGTVYVLADVHGRPSIFVSEGQPVEPGSPRAGMDNLDNLADASKPKIDARMAVSPTLFLRNPAR